MLGIATTTGDFFTYIVLPITKKNKYGSPVSRSVVRIRNPRDDDVYIKSELHDPKKYYFTTSDGRRLTGDTDLVPAKDAQASQQDDQSVSSMGSSAVAFDETETFAGDEEVTPPPAPARAPPGPSLQPTLDNLPKP